MKLRANKSGFTLLEIIIVIIIIGVLASLALPRLFSTVEFSRSTEALASFATIRGSLERCYLINNANYSTCNSFANLDIDDPKDSPNAHFTYEITTGAAAYTITAWRNTIDGGKTTSTIKILQTTAGITKGGGDAFSTIK